MAELNEKLSSVEHGFDIQLAEPKDFRAICELVSRAYQTPMIPGGFSNRADDTEEMLAREIAEGTKIFIVKKDGLIIGTQRYRLENDCCHLTRLAVAPEFRNQGIGRKLVEKVLIEGKNRGAKTAKLEVLEERGLVPYYESFGFQTTETKPHHKHTLVLMEKKLV